MKVIDTKIADVKMIEPSVFNDDRGYFVETFQADRYQRLLGIDKAFVQDNYSRSRKGVLRGLHYQKVNPQAKLVRVVRGAIFDVAVDIRKGSVTFGQWVGVELTETNMRQLYIPEGFAHGFVALTEIADVEYKCTDYYDPSNEACIKWNDPDLGITWPIKSVILSDKDEKGLRFKDLLK